MAGGLLQIIAYGPQDMYLTNNPQITFFKTVYRQHTNFSIETFEYTIQDNPNFGKMNTITIPKNGDLITKMYLKVILNKVELKDGEKFAWVRRIGHALLRSVEVDIGGVRIDKQYGTWLDIWYDLVSRKEEGTIGGLEKLLGDTPELTEYNNKSKPEYTLFIPLKFWFNRHYGLALPMIAIQYHEVRLHFVFENADKLVVTSKNYSGVGDFNFLEADVLVDYVYLDKYERRKFANYGNEYLIEQVQFEGEDEVINDVVKLQLTFNHPVKELFWCMRNGNYTNNKKFICYSHKNDWSEDILRCSKQVIKDSIILLNGPITENDGYGNEIIIVPGEDPPENGDWEEFESGSQGMVASGNIQVLNGHETKSLWVNANSLSINSYSLTNKIFATIEVLTDETIQINNVSTTLTARDISIPVDNLIDTRINSDNDVCVNQFINYGVWIDGSVNPIAFSLLEFNDQERFERRDGDFFNYLHPEMHHSNTPRDGLNVYSFSIFPEEHQPSGTANFSKIERIILTLWLKDISETPDLPKIDIIVENTLLCVFAFSYNILRVMNGLAGIAYNG